MNRKIALAAEGSDILLELMAGGQTMVDYVQVGPWLGQDKLLDRIQQHPVLMHCNDALISPGFQAKYFADLVTVSETPWLSLHLCLPDKYRLWQRAGIPIPVVRRRRAQQIALDNLIRLKHALNVPVAIENQAHHRRSGHDYLADPVFIGNIVNEGDTWLLLDLGHGRVSAAMRGETPEDYVGQLPLARVLEIHISGPGLYRGRLRDLHRPLGDADYEILRHTLPRCENLRAVTLEYYGPAPILAEQLRRLHDILYSAVPTIVRS